MGKSAGSPPPAPDYVGAAEAEAQSQRINQYTPYGNLYYSPVGSGGAPAPTGAPMTPGAPSAPPGQPSAAPTAGATAAPSGQATPSMFDIFSMFNGNDQDAAQQRVQAMAGTPAPAAPAGPQQWQSQTTLDPAMQGIRNSQLGFAGQKLSKPMDMSSVGDIADKAYGTMTARLDPQWNQREQAEQTRLANQGLVPGGEAYGNAMREFNNARNDAYQQANLGAISTMPQTYNLAESQYMQPLNVLNSLRSQDPQFGGAGQPTGYMDAATAGGNYAGDLYNARVGARNAQTQGLTQAATTAAMLYMLAPASDRRLKSNIERIGTHPLGVGIYEYDIFDRHEIGVMADEVEQVMPEAVIVGHDGYKRVAYGMFAPVAGRA